MNGYKQHAFPENELTSEPEYLLYFKRCLFVLAASLERVAQGLTKF